MRDTYITFEKILEEVEFLRDQYKKEFEEFTLL